MSIINITDSNFESEVIEAKGKVLVDMWAPWCGPCRMLGPVIEEIADEQEGNLKVCKLNVDENPGTAGKYRVMSIPTMLLFEDGKLVKKMIGFKPKEDILEEIGL